MDRQLHLNFLAVPLQMSLVEDDFLGTQRELQRTLPLELAVVFTDGIRQRSAAGSGLN